MAGGQEARAMDQRLSAIREAAVMGNRTSVGLEETGLMVSEARGAAAQLGWGWSATAGLNEFTTRVRPVWFVFRAEGQAIYLAPHEWAAIMRRMAGLEPGSATHLRPEGDWELVAWTSGEVFLRRFGRLVAVTRLSEAEVIVQA